MNTKNKLDMNEFRIKKKKIDDQIFKTYDKIYNLVINNIKLCANNYEECCIFSIPFFMFGEQTYDMNQVSEYLIEQLNIEITKKNLSIVNFYEPNILYIEWSLQWDKNH